MKNNKGYISIPIIIGLLFVVVVAGYFVSRNRDLRPTFSNQTECEQKTGQECVFAMCDYGWQCAGFTKGWKPSLRPISTSTVSQVDTTGWQTYTDSQHGFEFRYPADFNLGSKVVDNSIINLQFPERFYHGTNLGQVTLFLTVTSTPTCPTVDSRNLGYGYIDTDISLNGISFHKTRNGDSAMGSHYETTLYTTTHNNQCFSIGVQAVSFNDINGYNTDCSDPTYLERYPKGHLGCSAGLQVVLYSPSILEATAEQILSTFKFISPTSSVSSFIDISSPKNGGIVSSPLKIKGTTKPGWVVFEAQAGTATLYDGNGNKLGFAILKAIGEWMKPEVDFEGTLVFTAPKTGTGKLVFKDDNPKDESEAKMFEMPVKFAPAAPTSSVVVPAAPASNLQITRPAGGEEWIAGDDYVIRWSNGSHNLEFSLMQGDRGKGIITDVDGTQAAQAEYRWTIPKDTLPGIYQIIAVEYVSAPCFASSTSSCREVITQSVSRSFSIISP